jgi:hypothetical protein
MDFKHLYEKYKQKYIQLKNKLNMNQNGGKNNICKYGSLCYRTENEKHNILIHKCIYCGSNCVLHANNGYEKPWWRCIKSDHPDEKRYRTLNGKLVYA